MFANFVGREQLSDALGAGCSLILTNFHRISSFHCLSSEPGWGAEIRLSYLCGRELRVLKYNFKMRQLKLR